MPVWMTIKQKFSPLLLAILLIIIGNGCSNTSQNVENSSEQEENQSNSRLGAVSNRGNLICGVNGQLPGFSFVDAVINKIYLITDDLSSKQENE